MFEYKTEILIRRPPEQVFAYLTNLELIPEWAEPVEEVHLLTAGELDVGTRFDEIVPTPFGKTEVHWEIVEFEPDRKCTFASESFLGLSDVTFVCEPADSGTLLVVRGSGRGRGLLRPLSPLLGRRALALREASMRHLKETLESKPPASGA